MIKQSREGFRRLMFAHICGKYMRFEANICERVILAPKIRAMWWEFVGLGNGLVSGGRGVGVGGSRWWARDGRSAVSAVSGSMVLRDHAKTQHILGMYCIPHPKCSEV